MTPNTLTPLFLSLAAASALLSNPIPAHAVALGEIISLSALGEPLRVDILVAAGDATEAGECLRVTAGAANAGPWVNGARITTSVRKGRSIVTVIAPASATEPVMRLGIDNVCGSRLRREYTLLLPFPIVLPGSQAAAADQAPLPATSPAPTARKPTPTPRQVPAPATQTWFTAPGESLDSLAAALHPRDRASRERFIADTARANPGLFPDRASHARPLPPDTALQIPDPARAAASPPASTQPRQAATRARTPPTAAAGAPPTPVTPQARGEDRLVVDVDRETAQPATSRPTIDNRSTVQERELVAAIDRSIQAQLDLLERIRDLERIQAELIERANRLGNELPAPTAAVQPAPAPVVTSALTSGSSGKPDSRGESSPTRDWMLYLAFFAAVVATLLGLQALVRRRRERLAAMERDRLLSSAPASAFAWPEEAHTTGGFESARGGQALDQPARPAAPPPPAYEWAAPSAMSVAVAVEDEHIEEHESAVELAEIMMSFGRVQGAAETLADFIRGNPQQAVQPWLKLLDVYRAAGMRAEFDGLSRQLNKTFNVRTVTWDNYDEARQVKHHLEDMPHVIEQLTRTWRTVECQAYLETLLRDNREGTRQGFPLSVVDELLLLAAVLEDQLGRYRPPGLETAAAAPANAT